MDCCLLLTVLTISGVCRIWFNTLTAQFLWLSILLFTADRIFARSKKLYRGGLLVCVLAVMFICYDNSFNPGKGSVPVMTSLPKYLDRVYVAEQQHLTEQNRTQVIQLGDSNFSPSAKLGRVGDPTVLVELIQVEE